jgi:hypothetical protein
MLADALAMCAYTTYPYRDNKVRSGIATLPKKGQQCVVRQVAGAMVGMETMMIKMLKSHTQV